MSGALLLFLAACTPDDPALGTYVGDEVTHNDFESLRGWATADTAALTTALARSGRWAVRVDAVQPVGPVFKAPLGAASVHTLKAIEVEAWVYLPVGQSDAELRVEIWPAAGGGFLHREAWPLRSQVRSVAEWVRVRHTFKLPAGSNSADYLCLTLAHIPNAGPIYLDDLTVKALE